MGGGGLWWAVGWVRTEGWGDGAVDVLVAAITACLLWGCDLRQPCLPACLPHLDFEPEYLSMICYAWLPSLPVGRQPEPRQDDAGH